MTTTNLDSLDTDDLRRLAADGTAAQAQEVLQRRERQRAAEESERQRAWDAELVARHVALEDHLVKQGQAARAAFDQAVLDRDLPGAFAAWITERATRRGRQVVRDEARVAERNAQTGIPVSDVLVTWYRPDFLARLEERADKAADRLGDDMAERLIGPRPGEVE